MLFFTMLVFIVLLVMDLLAVVSGQTSPSQRPLHVTIGIRTRPGNVIFSGSSTPDVTATFYLLQTNSSNNKNPVSFEPFLSTALNDAIDDCNLQLTKYPVPRQYFCIDHKNGFVKLQSTDALQHGLKYTMEIQRKTSTSTTSLLHTVEVVDYCKLYAELIEKTAKSCSEAKLIQFRGPTQNQALKHTLKIILPKKRMYLVRYFVLVNQNNIILERSSGSITLKTTFGTVKLPTPLIVQSGETFNVSAIDAQGKGILSTESRFTFYFVPVEDTCSSMACRNITRDLNGIREECPGNIDVSAMNVKYGTVCEGSAPPTATDESIYEFKYNSYKGINNEKIVTGPFSKIFSPELEYSLIKLTGQIQNTTTSKTLTSCARKNTGSYSFLMNTQICMDKGTGDIFINDNFVGSIPKILSLEISIANTSYPYRAVTKAITVKLSDICSPTGDNYNKLKRKECRANLKISILSEDGLFPRDPDTVRYLGIKISKNVIIQDDDFINIVMRMRNLELAENEVVLISKGDLKSYKGFAKYLPINETQSKQIGLRIDMFSISIQGTTIDPAKGPTKNINFSPSDISLYYLTSWDGCNQKQCLSDYKIWRTSILSAKEETCKLDPVFMERALEPCLDLKLAFGKAVPRIQSNILQGCQYSSIVNLNQFSYYMLNQTQRINSSSASSSTQKITPNATLTSFQQKGTFQCVIYDPERMKQPFLSGISKFQQIEAPAVVLQPRSFSQIESVTNVQVASCSFKSFIKPELGEVYLLKDRQQVIPVNPSIKGDLITIIFEIKYLKISDGGSYECVLYPKGLDKPVKSKVFNLTVEELVVNFENNPTVSLKIFGAGVNIRVTGCALTINGGGNPFEYAYYYVYYSKDGEELGKVKARISGRGTAFGSSKFTFNEYIVEGYQYLGSFYACRVQHPNISSFPTTSDKSPEFKPYPTPSFIPLDSPLIGTVFIGDDVKLPNCAFTTVLVNKMNMTYLKDDQHFQQMQSSSIRYDEKGYYNVFSNTIVLKNVTKSMEGRYRCAVHFPGPSWSPIKADEIQVKVQSRNITITALPKLKENVKNGYMELLGCSYTIAPTRKTPNNIVFTWLYNGTVLQTPSLRPPLEEEDDFDGKLPVFPPLIIRRYDQVGYYACRITIGAETVMSKNLFLENLPAPSFIQHPIATHKENVKSGNLEIKGCILTSLIELKTQYVSWYKNGFKNNISAVLKDVSPPRIQDSSGGRNSFYEFQSLDYSLSLVSHQGFHQCAVTLPDGRVLLSNRALVQFSDVSWTTSQLTLDRPYLADYSNRLSESYKKLEELVTFELQKTMSTSQRKAFVVIDGFKPGSTIVSASIMYEGMSPDGKIEVCTNLNQMKNDASKINGLGITGVKMITQDCCSTSTFGEASFKGVYSYPVSLIKSNVTLPCVYDASKTTSRVCKSTNQQASWNDPDLANCPAKTEATNNLISLNQKTVCSSTTTKSCESGLAISAKLSDIVNNTKVVSTHQDVSIIANIIQNILNAGQLSSNENTTFEESKNITNNIFDCLNNVITSDDTKSLAQSQIEEQSSTSILDSIDQIAIQIGNKIKQNNQSGNVFTVTKSSIAMSVDYRPPSNVTVSAVPDSLNQSNVVINFVGGQEYNVIDSMVKVRVPSEVFYNSSQILHSVFYTANTLFQTSQELSNAVGNNGSVVNRQVNSNVLKVSVGNMIVRDLSDPVLLTFTRNNNVNGEISCEFWNFSLPTYIPNVFGKWSGNGCVLDPSRTSGNQVACKCDHMTNFAILMDVSQTHVNPLALQIVTWIGCGLSLAGLFLTLLTYLVFKDLRKKLPPKILIALCISLMALLIIFLVGVEATSSRIGCQIVAALLQYFMLSTFCWMAVEGVNLYRNFVTIFGTRGTGKFFLKASAFAWGIPLIVMVVTSLVKPDNLGNENFCVVVGYSFYFGVLLPVAAVLLGNFLVLVLVLRSLNASEKKSLNKKQEKDLTKSIRIAFGANVLLGTTWIFGLLAVGDLRTVFQWLFTISNALQGFFIFIFYTVRNQEARKKWSQLLPHFGRHSHGTSVPTTSDSPMHSYKMNTLSTTDGKNSTSHDNPHLSTFGSSKGQHQTLPKY